MSKWFISRDGTHVDQKQFFYVGHRWLREKFIRLRGLYLAFSLVTLVSNNRIRFFILFILFFFFIIFFCVASIMNYLNVLFNPFSGYAKLTILNNFFFCIIISSIWNQKKKKFWRRIFYFFFIIIAWVWDIKCAIYWTKPINYFAL